MSRQLSGSENLKDNLGTLIVERNDTRYSRLYAGTKLCVLAMSYPMPSYLFTGYVGGLII